jgi:hypothetical protein
MQPRSKYVRRYQKTACPKGRTKTFYYVRRRVILPVQVNKNQASFTVQCLWVGKHVARRIKTSTFGFLFTDYTSIKKHINQSIIHSRCCMKKSLLLVVFSMLSVAGTAQKFENVLRYGLNHQPKFEDRALNLFQPAEQLALPESEKGNTVQAFAPVLNLSFGNPIFGYYIPGNIPIVYEPNVNSVFLIFNEQTGNGNDIGVNCKIYQTATGLKSFSSSFKVMTSFGSDYLGMPQLAVMNPEKTKNADGLHYLMIARQYLKASSYMYTAPTMFLKTSPAVADPFPLEGPQDNNAPGYRFGAGGLVSFSGSDAEGCVMSGVLGAPNEAVQYGQYGTFVYEATSQEPQSSIPNAWANSQFRAAPNTTSSYNGPMYSDIDPDGVVYAACNAIFADDQNNRLISFSKSTNLGKTWSDFTRMPKSTLDNYATSRGQAQAVFVQPYQQDAFIVTGKDQFSYFARVALFDSGDQLQALDIVEFEYNNGNWTTRGISGFADVPTFYVSNDSVNQSTNYTRMKAFRFMNPMGNELEAARTADGSSVVLKWVDYNTDLGPIIISPAQTILIQDQQTGAISEGTLDTTYATDVFLSSRAIGGGDWSKPSNLTNDKAVDKGTHMPRLVPAIDKIPMISFRPVTKATWPTTSNTGKLVKTLPDEYISRIYNLWSTVNYSLFSGVTSVENDNMETLNFALNSPAPSPAFDELDVTYSTEQAGHVRITVSNMLGQSIATVVDATVDSGLHGTVFNTAALASGNYILTMSMNGRTTAQSFIVAH